MRALRLIPALSGVLVAAALSSGSLSAQGRAGAPAGGRGAGAGAVNIQPGQECPPGTTLVRVGQCRAPDFPPPSIVDYRPRSTLVVPQHPVPMPKYRVVDVHGHAPALTTAAQVESFIKQIDSVGIQVYVAADNVMGDRLRQSLAAVAASPYKDRIRFLTGVSFAGAGTPGWGERSAQQVEADIKAGAIGVGEISKSFGLTLRKADGSRLKVDDPDLVPVWETLGRLKVPVFIHTAEPAEFFSPLDMHNERWLELALFADRRNYEPGQVKFEELMTERDNLFRRHPNTTFIAAHMGWHTQDLGRLSKLLDEFPNVYVELGAVLYDIGRQPKTAHDFFVKYQDRIMFGKDAFATSEYPYYWRVLETQDEYFDYYRDYHAFWKLYGIYLPDDVLKKVYYGNAVKLFTGLPQTGWPGN
jgi:uncharacterized protein